jgi:hypothetical protein
MPHECPPASRSERIAVGTDRLYFCEPLIVRDWQEAGIWQMMHFVLLDWLVPPTKDLSTVVDSQLILAL